MPKKQYIWLLLLFSSAAFQIMAQEKTEFRKHLERGNSLRIENPDSARVYYHRALSISQREGDRHKQSLAMLRLGQWMAEAEAEQLDDITVMGIRI